MALDEDRDLAITSLAKERWNKDGEIEIDEEGTWQDEDGWVVDFPVVSESEDNTSNGAYVRAWLWVDFAGTDLDKSAVENH